MANPQAEVDDDYEQYLINALQVLGDWSAHDDANGHIFYYNHETKQSVWEPPQEFKGKDGELMMQLMLQDALAHSGPWSAHDTGKGTLYYFNKQTRESVWKRPKDWGQYADEEPQAKDITLKKKTKKSKKPKQTEETTTSTTNKDKSEETPHEEPLTEAEKAAIEAKLKEKQQLAEQFRQMLRDKKIMPFCQWSVAFPKIAMDPRFIAVPTMDERRAIFDAFVKNRRDDLKAEKKEQLKKAKKHLLHVLKQQISQKTLAIDTKTTLSVFLTALEKRDETLYAELKKQALDFLSMQEQQKIWDKMMTDHRDELRQQEQVAMKFQWFLEDKVTSTATDASLQWEDAQTKQWIRAFATSAKEHMIAEAKQKQIFDKMVTTHRPGPVIERSGAPSHMSKAINPSPTHEALRAETIRQDTSEQVSDRRKETKRSIEKELRGRSSSRRHSRSSSRSRLRAHSRHRSRSSSLRRSRSRSRSHRSSRSSRSRRRSRSSS